MSDSSRFASNTRDFSTSGMPGLALPANSGFYLVLQVHYKHQVTVGDFSGIGLRLSNIQPEFELNSMWIYLDTEAHIASFGKGKQGLASPNLTEKATILSTLLVNFLPTCIPTMCPFPAQAAKSIVLLLAQPTTDP